MLKFLFNCFVYWKSNWNCEINWEVICLALRYHLSSILFLMFKFQTSLNSNKIDIYVHVQRGQKKVCLIFFILHLFVGVWKSITAHPSVWVANICLSLASSIFSFNFETWVAIEHEKVCVNKLSALFSCIWYGHMILAHDLSHVDLLLTFI